MRLLDRYIGRAVVSGTLLALLVLLAMFSFFSLIDNLADVGRGNYGVGNAIEYVLLTMPRRAFDTFPIAALIGSLLGLGLLAGNSELTVVRAAGVSLWRIVGAVMKAALVLMAIAMVLGEFVAPPAETLAQTRRNQALSAEPTLMSGGGLWARDGTSFINIREMLPDDIMGDVTIYEFDEQQQLRTATRAQRARYADGRWLLEGVAQSRIGGDGVQVAHMERAEWTSAFSPDMVNVTIDEPSHLSAWGLIRYIRYLGRNGQETAPYELGLWSKLVAPVATGVMILLSVPFVFGPLRAVSVGQRILVGVLVGIGFQIMNQMFSKLGLVYGLSPFFSATLPTLLFFVVALWMARRVN